MVLAISIIATLIVSFIIIDSHGNFGILLFITFEFGLSMIMFAFILTSFFTKAKTAAAAGGLMVVLLSCFYYLQVFMENVPTGISPLYAKRTLTPSSSSDWLRVKWILNGSKSTLRHL